PCGLERLLGLQHDREFREVEATHIDERARPLLGRHAGRMGKGVAHLAQCHQPKRRRQVERGSRRGAQARALLQRHLGPGLAKVVCNNYNVVRTRARAALGAAPAQAGGQWPPSLDQSPRRRLPDHAPARMMTAKYMALVAQPETKWPIGRRTS